MNIVHSSSQSKLPVQKKSAFIKVVNNGLKRSYTRFFDGLIELFCTNRRQAGFTDELPMIFSQFNIS